MDRRRFIQKVVLAGMASSYGNDSRFVFCQETTGYDSSGWEPIGLSGGGSMYTPAISPVDDRLIMLNCDMSCAFLSSDGGMSWRMIHHAQLRGNTRCRAGFHPQKGDVIFAPNGWTGRLHISYDRGNTWKEFGDLKGRLEGEIAIDPGNPDRMLAGSDRRVWQSDDGGSHWTPVEGPQGAVLGFHFDRTSSDRHPICFAATDQGLWRSDDGGKTWIDQTKNLPWNPLQGFMGGSNKTTNTCILYCTIPSKNEDGFKGGVYRSMDRGETWISAMGSGINQQITDGRISQYYHVLTTNVDPQIVYVFNQGTGYSPPYHSTCYRSDDAGENWRAVLFANPQFAEFNLEQNYHTAYMGTNDDGLPLGVAIAPSNPDVVLTTDSMKCYVTRNGGKSWMNGHSRPASLKEKVPKEFLNTGLVVTSTWNYYIDPFERDRHYIAYTDIGFARSLNAGKTWRFWPSWARTRQIPWYNTCYELAFDPETPGKIWGAFSNVHDIPNGNVITGTHWTRLAENQRIGGIAVSEDFAENWKKSNEGLPPASACSVVLDPKSPKGRRTLYAAIYTKGVYQSVDDGKTWIPKNQGLGSTKNMRACRVIFHADGTLFCLITALYEEGKFESEGVGLYRSTDEGEHWELVNRSQLFLWPKDFTVHPKDSNEIYLGACDIRRDEAQGGLWRTRDGGITWKRIARKGTQHFGAYLHPSRSGWIYITLCEEAPEAGLWLSKDDGETWQPFDQIPFCNIQRVIFDPQHENTIFVTTFGGSVFKGPIEPNHSSRS